MRIEFDIYGDKQVSRDLLRIAEHAGNLKPVFRVMARYFYAMEKKQFATEGGFASGGWPALKEETLRRKAAKGQRHEILRADDVLMKSLTGPNAPFSLRTIRETELFLGTADPVAEFHQSQKPRTKIPLRRPVEFRKRDRVAWVKMLQDFVITGRTPAVPTI